MTIDATPDAPPYESAGHVAYSSDREFFLAGDELLSAPLANPVDPESRRRAGAMFEATLPDAAGVLAAAFSSMAGGSPADWMPEAERLLTAGSARR